MKKTFLLFGLVALFLLPAFAGASNERGVSSEAGTEAVLEEEDNPVYIMDMRFLRRLIDEGVDTNGDGLISYEEAEAVIHLDVGIDNNCFLTNKMIADLTGIEAFVNLESLSVQGNLLTHMDISSLTQLKVLNCEVNILNRLDVSNNTALEELNCRWNQIGELDLTQNASLKRINVGYNQFSTLDVTKNEELTHFSCNSRITEAQAYCASFRNTYTERKALTSLDLTRNSNLEYLLCCGRSLKKLDLSKSRELKSIFLIGMSDKCDVAVWCENFPPKGISLQEICCTSMKYKDIAAPELSADGTDEPAGSIQVSSSETGLIYLVPEGTGNTLDEIRDLSLVSYEVLANSPVEISTNDLGTENIWVYASDNSGNVSARKSIATSTVGMGDALANSISIYPNPTQNFVTLQLETPGAALDVFSMVGQRIFSRTNLEGSCQIDLSDFQNGIYLFTLRSAGISVTQKVIKY